MNHHLQRGRLAHTRTQPPHGESRATHHFTAQCARTWPHPFWRQASYNASEGDSNHGGPFPAAAQADCGNEQRGNSQTYGGKHPVPSRKNQPHDGMLASSSANYVAPGNPAASCQAARVAAPHARHTRILAKSPPRIKQAIQLLINH